CGRLLAAELGVEPSPETAALYERIRAAVASPTLSLPAEPTPLVGRLAEVTLLSRQLRTADCRLLTVTGPGGVGKSRLTLAVAERLAGTGDFLHQVAYVPLAGVASPAFLAPAIAEACQFAFSGREDLQAQLLNYLSQKEMLLVLDSFDHLLSTPDDSPATPIQNPLVFLADLLRRAPAVKLLVTSRERLNLNGEWVFPLNGLTQTEGLGLFQQSAARARPGFIFTESNQAAVERICHLVDGLPLGIELAASWVRVLSCAEIAAEIEGSLDFLASNARDGPERQRSLRVVLDTSWQMLTPAEQAAFTQLFLFRGTFQREAAAKVAGATLSILSGLVDKSIIHRHPNGRYELHELLRRYAEEQMGQGGERAALQSRHAAYFAAWAQQMETQLQGGEGQRAALDDLAAEIENVRAGWQWAVQRGRLAELEQYERPLYEFYHTRSWLQEGCETFSEAVAAVEPLAETADKQRLLSKLLGRQAAFYDHLGHYEQAKEILRRALVMAQEVEARPVISFLQLKLGRVAHNLGDMATAKTHLEAALAVSRSLNDAVAMANNLEGLAIIALNLGDFDQARRLRESSLELYQQAGDQRGMMVALNNMGAIAYSCAEYAEAKRRFSESAALSRVLSDRRSLAIALHNLSEVSYRLGQYEEALRLGYESLALFEEIGYPLGVIHGRLNLGNIYTALGEAEAALGEYRPALGSALALSAMSLAVEVLLGFARLFIQRGQKELALERLAFAIHHPALPQSERLEAEQLFAEVAAGLPEGIVAAAEARGRALSLEELAA
ncbi:MAG: tetratricopeptide repeat protein, partial [Chloroflexota bacterium]